jgi:hypothetical protein
MISIDRSIIAFDPEKVWVRRRRELTGARFAVWPVKHDKAYALARRSIKERDGIAASVRFGCVQPLPLSLHHRHAEEIEALRRETVFGPHAARSGAEFKQSGGDKPVQTIREDTARQAQALQPIGEAMDTEEGVAQDQLRPCISHDRECATDRVTQNRVFQTLIHDFGSSVGDEFHDHQVEVSFEEADPRFCPAQAIR